jgi:hypothetical protein
LPALEISEDLAGTFLDADFLTGGTIIETFLVVYLDQTTFRADRFGRADLDAFLAGNAADLAYLHDILAEILGGTRLKHPGFKGHQFDNLLGTGFDAGPATHAFVGIDLREAFNHGNGVEGTNRGAFAKTDT